MKKLVALLFFISSIPLFAADLKDCETVFNSAKARIEKCDGLKVVKLHGSASERAETLGTLEFEGHLSSTVIEQYSSLPERLAPNSALIRMLVRYKIRDFASPTLKQLRREKEPLFTETETYLKNSGLSDDVFWRAAFLPDVTSTYLGKPGCSSFFLRDEGWILGRNLDFGGVGAFDAHPTLYVHIPSLASSALDGELAHAAISAEGLHLSSISGFNEKGIYLAVHKIEDSRIDQRQGMPLYFVGEKVLRQAKSLGEAIDLLKKYSPINIWMFMLVDMNNGKAVSVEVGGGHFYVREMKNSHLAQTNHLQSITTGERDPLYHGKNIDSIRRFDVIEKILENRFQTSETQRAERLIKARKLLSNRLGSVDFASPGNILKPDTIQSFLMYQNSDGNNYLQIGIGAAPVSSSDFIEVPLANLFSRTTLEPVRFSTLPSLTDSPQRALDVKLTDIYERYLVGKERSTLLPRLAELKSADALLFKAYLLMKSGKLLASSKLMKENARLFETHLMPHQKESWDVMEFMVRKNRDDRTGARKICARFHARDPQNTMHQERMRYACKTAQHQKISAFEIDFFAGDYIYR